MGAASAQLSACLVCVVEWLSDRMANGLVAGMVACVGALVSLPTKRRELLAREKKPVAEPRPRKK